MSAEAAEEEPPKKRLRQSKLPTHVYVSCFDESDKLQEIDFRILQEYDCRLYKHIKYDPPTQCAHTGRPYWRTDMTRAMLQTFMRALKHGELSLSVGVSVAEALNTFKYEGVFIRVPPSRLNETKTVQDIPGGVGFEKRAERVTTVVIRTSEQVASAIACWPRLEETLDSSLTGSSHHPSASPTCCWVRFATKPHLNTGSIEVATALARKCPLWVWQGLVSMGLMHAQLVRDGVVGPKDRSEESYRALQEAVEANFLGTLFFVRDDWTHQGIPALRKGEKFATEMKQSVLDGAPVQPTTFASPESKEEELKAYKRKGEALAYAKGCFCYMAALLNETPAIARIFAGSCCDESCRSFERAQLARALQARGIKLLKWSEDAAPRPLCFPYAWSVVDNAEPKGAMCLLSFKEAR
jgi:hypothetical protein